MKREEALEHQKRLYTKVVGDLVARHPDKAQQAKARPALAGWFVGRAMKVIGGSGDPEMINAVVITALGL